MKPCRPSKRPFWLCAFSFAAVLGIAVSGLAVDAAPAFTPQQIEFFESKVRPLLAEQCFGCHSSRVKKPQGGLRLDSRAALLKGGELGPAVVPGKPESSLLIRAVRYENRTLQMPPKGRLAVEQVQVLEEWIRVGAPWPAEARAAAATAAGAFDLAARRAAHWAWHPIRRPPVPRVKQAAWVRTPVDAFILSALEKKGLAPSPEADRRTLIRRVTFVLTGLPPTPEEVEAFLADRRPDAYERVVDRLLASPRYGERWARHWLDLVRYADTDGHEFDFEKPGAYHYRDALIRGFNADVPYDRMVMEHVAGDLLPEPRLDPVTKRNESLTATGFWWLGEGKHSPVDLLVDEAERIDNQIDVFGKTFLGLTLGCARCHDHKFDAISARDYYALYGYLQSSRFRFEAVDEERPIKEAAIRLAKIHADNALSRGVDDWRGAADEIRRSFGEPGVTGLAASMREAARLDETHPLHLLVMLGEVPLDRFAQARSESIDRLRSRAEAHASWRRAGITLGDFDGGHFGDWSVAGDAFGTAPVRGLRAASGEADSGHLSHRLWGAIRSRSFPIERDRIWLRASGMQARVNVVVDGFQRIRAPLYGGLTLELTGGGEPRWHSMNVSKLRGHTAYVEVMDSGPGYARVDQVVCSDSPPPPPPIEPSLVDLLDRSSSWLDLRDRTMKLLLEGVDDLVNQRPTAASRLVGAVVGGGRSAVMEASLADQVRTVEKSIPSPTMVLAITDGTPEDERIHVRGNPATLGDPVPRRFLEALGGRALPAQAGSGRLELARAMVAPTTPLVPRVMVNRVWQHDFGEGLARTPDDFGLRGDRPSNPELLDWLSSVFTAPVERRDASGTPGMAWSLKKLHRLLLVSSTFRMSTQASPAALARDPQNRLNQHARVRRLEAEAIRDAVLAVSGRLDTTMFGPGPLPYLTPFLVGRGRPAESGPVDGNGRRSVYLNVRRNFLNPMLLAFDAPIPFTTIGRRSVSTVPAQALTMMNNPFVVEQAGVWAERVLKSRASPEKRVEEMYLAAFSRPPTAEETSSSLGFLREQASRHGCGIEEPKPWRDLCHVLLNVKEFIFLN